MEEHVHGDLVKEAVEVGEAGGEGLELGEGGLRDGLAVGEDGGEVVDDVHELEDARDDVLEASLLNGGNGALDLTHEAGALGDALTEVLAEVLTDETLGEAAEELNGVIGSCKISIDEAVG